MSHFHIFQFRNPNEGGIRGTTGEHGRVFYLKGRMNLESLVKAQMADEMGTIDGEFGENLNKQSYSNEVYKSVKSRGKILVTGTFSFL